MINFNKIYICPFFVLLIINCSSWSKKEWSQLNNKNFYFHKFSYYEKFGSNKIAFNIAKKVPIVKILKIAEGYQKVNPREETIPLLNWLKLI